MQVLFCMGLEHALDKVPTLQVRVAYQDDAYFFGTASHLAAQWPTLVEALHEAGHRVRNHKCQFWSPLADQRHDTPEGVRQLAALIPRVRGGITLLGAAAQGDFEVQLNSPVLQSAAGRASTAQKLVSRIRDLVVAQPTLTTAHLAWFLTSKSAAHALSYDARLVPSVALGFVSEPVVRQIEDLARLLVQGGSGDLDEQQVAQLRLPGCLGGMGLRPEPQATFADAALWALWVSMRQRVPMIAEAIGLGPIECAGGPAAIQAQTRLAAAGVQVDTMGAVTFTRNATVEYEAGPWVHDTPTQELGSLRIEARPDYDTIANDSQTSRLPRRFASRIFKHLESLAATRLWAGLAGQRDRQAGLLSAGGAGNGGVWQNLPNREEDFFPSGHFKVASLRRLGGLSAPPGATCAIKVRANGTEEPECCGQILDASMVHPAVCKQGVARQRPHRMLAATMAGCLRKVGAEIDMERTVVELAHFAEDGEVTEAILDLWVQFPGHTTPVYLDVTIRCPQAQRYTTAWKMPGAAAAYAVKQKETRYGPRVLAIALETYGRVAAVTVANLESLACTAGSGIRDRASAPQAVSAWKQAITRAVVYSMADIDLLALGAAAVSTCALRGG